MNKYLIYCGAGTGGLFLTSVIANFLGIVVQPKFSKTGNCHDLGKGSWKGHNDNINFLGNHWDINFNPNSKIFYAHCGPIDQLKYEQPNVKVILIDYTPDDYYNITNLYVSKAWPDILANQPGEYDKWRGVDWPDYYYDVIQDNKIVRDEFINSKIKEIEDWIRNYDKSVVDYVVNFKTIMGLDELCLEDELSKILNLPYTDAITTLIKTYQRLNQQLYFF